MSAIEPTPQRVRRRAKEIREEREARERERKGVYDAERDGPTDEEPTGGDERDPDEGATLRSGPVEDEASEIARMEGVSTMRTPEDMKPLLPPPTSDAIAGQLVRGAEEEIEALGRRLGADANELIDHRLEEFREEIGELDQKPAKGFVYGSIYGALLCLGSLAGALILTKINRRD